MDFLGIVVAPVARAIWALGLTTAIASKAGAAETVTLQPGWNLLGLGVNASWSVWSNFSNQSQVISLWKWNAVTGKWAFYSPALTPDEWTAYVTSHGYEPLMGIAGGEGFWVNAKTAFTVELPAGAPLTSTTAITVPSGWQQIAVGDHPTPAQLNTLVRASAPSGLTSLWAWDAVHQQWLFYAPALADSGGTALADYAASHKYQAFTAENETLGAGTGLWVNTPTVTPPIATGAFQSMQTVAVTEPATPTLGLQDVVGTYRPADNPSDTSNIGTIAFKPGSTTTLQWTTQSGSQWDLSADFANGWLDTGTTNSYRSLNPISGLHFVLQFQSGKLIGFRFNDRLFLRDGVTALRVIAPGLHSYFNTAADPSTVPAGYTYGYSMYSAIWPLLDKPIQGFQAGMPGTWLNPNNEDFVQPLLPEDHPMRLSAPAESVNYWRGLFQSLEGSAGYWISTRFPSKSQKYRWGATPNGYEDQLSSPGWEFGTDAVAPSATKAKWALPMGSEGGAQLSNRLLVPPDGLTFKVGTAGEFFGIAWMALPLTQAKTGTTPVGNQNWTLFANATNFQGPVMFYIPDIWEVMAQSYPVIAGRGLDVRPAISKSLVMEMNSMPYFTAKDKAGVDYLRLTRLSFPTDDKATSYLLSDYTLYSSAALFDPVAAWIAGGPAVNGGFNPAGAVTPKLVAGNLYMWGDNIQMQTDHGMSELVTPSVMSTPKGGSAWGFKWKASASSGVFPEYYQRQNDYFYPVLPSQVPDETGLTGVSFAQAAAEGWSGTAYSSPSNWNTPAPVAGPFSVKLGDGSVVTYAWYRFIDQPSLQGFGWTTAEKNRLQAVVEKIHTSWKATTEFLPARTVGDLATLDSALLVTPPAGLEVGYVPIVVRQNNF